jgi:hypothetical protein
MTASRLYEPFLPLPCSSRGLTGSIASHGTNALIARALGSAARVAARARFERLAPLFGAIVY